MPSPRLLLSLLLAPAALAAAQQTDRDTRKIYGEFCAGCHGFKLEGGSGPSLIDAEWKNGGTDEAVAASIRDGVPAAGMPAFGSVVSDKELRGLVVYIREQAGHAAMRATPPPQPAADTVATSRLASYRIETAVTGLKEPWSVAFLPDGRTLITEKRGTLRVFEKGVLRPDPVTGTPAVDSNGQAGLFDVVHHPDFARNGWIYLAFSDLQTNEKGEKLSMTAVVRGRVKDNAWSDEEVIFRAPLSLYYGTGGVHFGGRIAFDRKGYVFFSIGERGRGPAAQDLTRPNGKIHRLHDDGRVPADNPFVKTPGALPSVWSYGHRNPQGLRFNADGELWSHEHGPRGGDELNLIRPGLNYGWPVATFGMNYNGTSMTDITARPDFQAPVTYWVPSIAPCGQAFYNGDRFPRWKNHLFVASLAAQELRRLELKDGRVVDQEVVFKGIGRLRDVATGPDGLIYVLLPDRIARIVPASP